MINKIIAVDFDGTIVEDKFPKIGKPIPFAFDTLKMLIDDGCKIILWTCRTGKQLEEAVLFCKNKGIEFYSINCNGDNESYKSSRKIYADYYIDDRNLTPLPGWGEIYNIIKYGNNFVINNKPKKKFILW